MPIASVVDVMLTFGFHEPLKKYMYSCIYAQTSHIYRPSINVSSRIPSGLPLKDSRSSNTKAAVKCVQLEKILVATVGEP